MAPSLHDDHIAQATARRYDGGRVQCRELGVDMPDDDQTFQDQESTTLLRQLLARVPDLRAREQAIVRAETKGSGSHAELDSRHKFGRFIWELSAQALGVAGDHLDTWRRLIEDAQVQPGFAHVTIARGAIETSSFCRWLVDPTLNSAERIRRGVAAQLDDWHERDLWERASGADKMPRVGNGRTGAERMKELVAGRSAAGVGEIQVPRLIELCRRYAGDGAFGGEALYRLASAFAHGKQWMLLVSSAELPDGAAPDEPGPRRVTALDTVSALVTFGAVRTFAAAVSDFEAYATSEARPVGLVSSPPGLTKRRRTRSRNSIGQ